MSNEHTNGFTNEAVQAAGVPQPASQSMSQETAVFYEKLTKGQLVAFLHADGSWYLYAPTPVETSASSAVQDVAGQ